MDMIIKPDLRFGEYKNVLQDIECDVLMCDPPYSERTHKGRRTGSEIRSSSIKYQSITRDDAFETAELWHDRIQWWSVIFGDHVSVKWHEEAWKSIGWYVFPPVVWVKSNSMPRVSGDGPTSSVEYISVARPIKRLPAERSGSRPGYYIFGTEAGGDIYTQTGKSFPGKKPLKLMKALILNYTNEGDLVVDPYAGEGTTLIAASSLGRRSVGSEVTKETHKKALQNIDAGITTDMFAA